MHSISYLMCSVSCVSDVHSNSCASDALSISCASDVRSISCVSDVQEYVLKKRRIQSNIYIYIYRKHV